ATRPPRRAMRRSTLACRSRRHATAGSPRSRSSTSPRSSPSTTATCARRRAPRASTGSTSTACSGNTASSKKDAAPSVYRLVLALTLELRFESLADLDELCASSLTAEDFIDALQQCALRSRAVEHPLLDAIADGRFHDLGAAIRRFLC